jgi:hypothetical protein
MSLSAPFSSHPERIPAFFYNFTRESLPLPAQRAAGHSTAATALLDPPSLALPLAMFRVNPLILIIVWEVSVYA